MAAAKDFSRSFLYRRLHRYSFAGNVVGQAPAVEGGESGRARASRSHDVEVGATGPAGASSEATGKKDRPPGADPVSRACRPFFSDDAFDPLPLDIASR